MYCDIGARCAGSPTPQQSSDPTRPFSLITARPFSLVAVHRHRRRNMCTAPTTTSNFHPSPFSLVRFPLVTPLNFLSRLSSLAVALLNTTKPNPHLANVVGLSFSPRALRSIVFFSRTTMHPSAVVAACVLALCATLPAMVVAQPRETVNIADLSDGLCDGTVRLCARGALLGAVPVCYVCSNGHIGCADAWTRATVDLTFTGPPLGEGDWAQCEQYGRHVWATKYVGPSEPRMEWHGVYCDAVTGACAPLTALGCSGNATTVTQPCQVTVGPSGEHARCGTNATLRSADDLVGGSSSTPDGQPIAPGCSGAPSGCASVVNAEAGSVHRCVVVEGSASTIIVTEAGGIGLKRDETQCRGRRVGYPQCICPVAYDEATFDCTGPCATGYQATSTGECIACGVAECSAPAALQAYVEGAMCKCLCLTPRYNATARCAVCIGNFDLTTECRDPISTQTATTTRTDTSTITNGPPTNSPTATTTITTPVPVVEVGPGVPTIPAPSTPTPPPPPTPPPCVFGTLVNGRCSCINRYTGPDCGACPAAVSATQACIPCAKDRRYGPLCELTCDLDTHQRRCKSLPQLVLGASGDVAQRVINQTCECAAGCKGGWQGLQCDQCGDGWDPTTCLVCAAGHYGPACAECNATVAGCSAASTLRATVAGDTCGCDCKAKWTGATCATCPGNFDAAAGCAKCLTDYFGPQCADHCTCNGHGSAQYTSAGCSCTCRPPWTPESNCSVCPPQWSADCQSCTPGHMGDPAKTCVQCPSPAMRGRCLTATILATGRCDCETCLPPYGGTQCDFCNFTRHRQCTTPVTCQPGYGIPPLCEPAPPGFIALADGRTKVLCPVADLSSVYLPELFDLQVAEGFERVSAPGSSSLLLDCARRFVVFLWGDPHIFPWPGMAFDWMWRGWALLYSCHYEAVYVYAESWHGTQTATAATKLILVSGPHMLLLTLVGADMTLVRYSYNGDVGSVEKQPPLEIGDGLSFGTSPFKITVKRKGPFHYIAATEAGTVVELWHGDIMSLFVSMAPTCVDETRGFGPIYGRRTFVHADGTFSLTPVSDPAYLVASGAQARRFHWASNDTASALEILTGGDPPAANGDATVYTEDACAEVNRTLPDDFRAALSHMTGLTWCLAARDMQLTNGTLTPEKGTGQCPEGQRPCAECGAMIEGTTVRRTECRPCPCPESHTRFVNGTCTCTEEAPASLHWAAIASVAVGGAAVMCGAALGCFFLRRWRRRTEAKYVGSIETADR